MLLLFCTLFLFFLVLHVPFYYVFVDSNRADKIASGPKMIPQVRFLLHLWVALKQFYSQLTFQNTHHLGNRYLRWNRQDKMNVVLLNAHFLNLTFFPFTQRLYIFFQKSFDFSFQDSKPVFWHPNNMVLTLVNDMRQFLVLTHVTNIGIADRTLPPPKEVDF
jgi:hypothetical protein